MLKLMAVLRTVFLMFIVVLTVRALTFSIEGDQTFEQQCRASVIQLRNATWYAIGWIAFETAVGWWLATRRPKGRELPASAPAPTSPDGPR